MLHCDVSYNNIVYGMRNGKPHFVLIYSELAMTVRADGTPECNDLSHHRPGTLPFIAIDLLQDLVDATQEVPPLVPRLQTPVHLLRYDFESLLWVALWCSMTAGDASQYIREEADELIETWQTGTLKSIVTAKRRLVTNHEMRAKIPLAPMFDIWRFWFYEWFGVVEKGIEVQDRYRTQLFVQRHIKLYNSKKLGKFLPPQPVEHETLNGTITKDTIMSALRVIDEENEQEELNSAFQG